MTVQVALQQGGNCNFIHDYQHAYFPLASTTVTAHTKPTEQLIVFLLYFSCTFIRDVSIATVAFSEAGMYYFVSCLESF